MTNELNLTEKQLLKKSRLEMYDKIRLAHAKRDMEKLEFEAGVVMGCIGLCVLILALVVVFG